MAKKKNVILTIIDMRLPLRNDILKKLSIFPGKRLTIDEIEFKIDSIDKTNTLCLKSEIDSKQSFFDPLNLKIFKIN